MSDAEVAETPVTAFTSRRAGEQIAARLIVRRVRRLQPTGTTGSGHEELFAAYRYHAVFTNSPLSLLQAEHAHRAHAMLEQVHADLKNGPLAHLPSGSFAANSAWLVLAATAFSLSRAAGTLASALHALATTATLRTQLINVPARLARSARRFTLHLSQHRLWQQAVQQLSTAPPGHPLPPPDRPAQAPRGTGTSGLVGARGPGSPSLEFHGAAVLFEGRHPGRLRR